MNKLMKFRLSYTSLLALIFMALGGSIAHGANVPLWFASKTSACTASVHKWIDKNDPDQKTHRKDLSLKDAKGGSIKLGFKGAEVGASFPGIGLDKKDSPGAGLCCIYDENGNEKFAQPVLGGNDECNSHLRVMKNEANSKDPKTKNVLWHKLLYWCVGERQNCVMDVWHEYHKE